jgi:iron complex outermembrane receptor protein
LNIITKGASELPTGASVEAASFGTTKERLNYSARFASGLNLVAVAAHSDSRGRRLYFPEFDSPDTNRGIAERADGEHYSNAFLGGTYGELSFEGAYVLREKGIPTASFGTVFNDPGTRTWDETGFASLKMSHAIGKALSLHGQVSYDISRYRGDYVFDYPPVTVNRDTALGEWLTAECLAVYRGVADHTMILGAEFQDNVRQNQANFDLAPSQTYLDLRHNSKRWAAYGQDEVRLTPRLILSIGLRHDSYAEFGSEDSPRLAMILIPSPTTSVKLMLGRAYRPPNQYEAFYYSPSPLQEPNPDLKPESIKTAELVVEHALGRRFRLTAYGFFYRIQDLISLQSDAVGSFTQFRNAGRIDSKGLELEMTGELGHGLRGRASYSFQDTVNVASDLPLTNSPRHLLKLNLAAPLAGDRLSAGFEAQYTSSRLTLAGRRAGGFTVANLTILAVRLVEGAEVSAGVYNLFDKRYGDPGSEEHVEDVIQQDGRNFRLTLTWRH